MATRDVKTNWGKLKASVLHVIGACDPARLGAVKLHKVLYYTDMVTFLASGQAVTGAVYRKRPFGPTCDALLPLLEELQRENAIKVDVVDYHGYSKKQFTAVRGPETNLLDENEIATLNEMIDFVCNQNSAKTISDFSHDMVWEMVEYGDVIPYYNAIHLVPNEVGADAINWAAGEIDFFADSGPKSENPKMAYRDVRALRESLEELSRSKSL